MGDAKQNDLTPIQINYIYDAAEKWGKEPWDEGAKNCSEAYDVSVRNSKEIII